MKSILIVDPSLFTLPYDTNLCNALGKLGVAVTLIGRPLRDKELIEAGSFSFMPFFFKMSERTRKKTRLKKVGVYLKAIEYIADWLSFSRYVKKKRPDVLHFQWLPAPAIDQFFIKRLKTDGIRIVTVHDTLPFHESPSSRLQSAGWKKAFKLFPHFIVHTNLSKKRLAKIGVPESAISIIPHGLLHFGNIREEEQSKKQIVFFGSIKRYKGIDILLKSFTSIETTIRKGWTLKIIGQPFEDVEKLKEMARQTNTGEEANIIWDLRFFKDAEIPSFLSSAAVVVFPYRDIDGSGALMTALSYKKAVLCSDVDAFKEILGEKSPLLFKKNDAASLKEKLESVMRNPDTLTKMRKETLRISNSIPSWEAIAQETLKVYEQ